MAMKSECMEDVVTEIEVAQPGMVEAALSQAVVRPEPLKSQPVDILEEVVINTFGKKQRKHYDIKYRDKWELEFRWLTNDEGKAYCIYCKKKVAGGRKHLQRHGCSAKHQAYGQLYGDIDTKEYHQVEAPTETPASLPEAADNEYDKFNGTPKYSYRPPVRDKSTTDTEMRQRELQIEERKLELEERRLRIEEQRFDLEKKEREHNIEICRQQNKQITFFVEKYTQE